MNQLTIFLKFQVQNVLKSFEEVATNLPDEIRKGNILKYHLCDDLKVISFLFYSENHKIQCGCLFTLLQVQPFLFLLKQQIPLTRW